MDEIIEIRKDLYTILEQPNNTLKIKFQTVKIYCIKISLELISLITVFIFLA